MATGFISHATFAQHDPGAGHPERKSRATHLLSYLQENGLLAELERHTPGPAPLAALEAVHASEHVEAIRATAGGPARSLDADTHVSAESWDAASLAAGGLLEATEQVRSGTWQNAFCAVRPPGHHAERDHAMGFCLFNNVAIAARSLRSSGIERVAIVDWDVHHGNGTQHIFEDDPTVFYASLHQHPLYPGTGQREERGRGDGEGATWNRPLPPGAGSSEWLSAFEEELLPALDAFAPEFLLISAGFDAHRDDPLAQTSLVEADFAAMTRGLLQLADRHAQGRVVSALEGGYDLNALARSASAHIAALKEHPCA